MSTLEISAIMHISGALFILFTLFTVISILFGDILILKLKLEEKYPKFARLIHLRQKVTIFSLIINFSLIFLVLIIIIFINFYALYYIWFIN